MKNNKDCRLQYAWLYSLQNDKKRFCSFYFNVESYVKKTKTVFMLISKTVFDHFV